jgi:hypothetical protein
MRPEASAALLDLGATTPGLAGAYLTEAVRALAVADAYGRAAQIVAEVRL